MVELIATRLGYIVKLVPFFRFDFQHFGVYDGEMRKLGRFVRRITHGDRLIGEIMIPWDVFVTIFRLAIFIAAFISIGFNLFR